MTGRFPLFGGAGAALLIGLGTALLLAGPDGAATLPGDPVSRASCGAGSQPEHGLQGEVPLADRNSGRSQLGYWCNLRLVGSYPGIGAGWQNAWYDHCDYYDTAQNTVQPGVQVLDVSDPAHPKAAANLTTPAMLGPWESLKVNQARGLLAGVAAYDGAGNGPLFFDVYDVKGDCAQPTELSSLPVNVPIGHEGNWSADGMTYYGSSLGTGTVAAIDVSNPAMPSLITVVKVGTVVHGITTSPDGKLLYVADIAGSQPDSNGDSNGLEIWDVSGIQSRTAGFVPTEVGHVYWSDGSTAQHPIAISYQGRPYVLFVDEGGSPASGAGRIIDVSNPSAPVIVSHLRLEIQEAANNAVATADTNGNGSFTYQGHYCTVDRQVDPTAAACGYFQSGIRVFDIRDPFNPREIAYYNPPAQVARNGHLQGSEHGGGFSNPDSLGVGQPPNLTADWCASQVRFFRAADGTYQLWGQCQDSGFMVLAFTNGAYPLATAATNVEAAISGPAHGSVVAAGSALPNTSAPARLPLLPVALLCVETAFFAALLLRRRRRAL